MWKSICLWFACQVALTREQELIEEEIKYTWVCFQKYK